MRTKVMITMAVVALAAATAGTAWAQNPGPTKEMTAAVAYDTLLSGNINGTVQGVAVHVDRPAWSYVTVAFGGSFVTGGGGDKINPIGSIGASRVYAGAGPGDSIPGGRDRPHGGLRTHPARLHPPADRLRRAGRSGPEREHHRNRVQRTSRWRPGLRHERPAPAPRRDRLRRRGALPRRHGVALLGSPRHRNPRRRAFGPAGTLTQPNSGGAARTRPAPLPPQCNTAARAPVRPEDPGTTRGQQ